jgi:small-conductance mechanosensitive channel
VADSGLLSRRVVRWCSLFALVGWLATPALAQVPSASPVVSFAAVVASSRPDAPATLTLANRDIVVLRAAILGRSSADRVYTAELLLKQLALGGPVHVTMRSLDGALLLSANGHDVFGILPLDVDELAAETLDSKGQAAVARLQQALDEMVEAQTPGLLLRHAIEAAGATAVFFAVIWVVARARRSATGWLTTATKQRVSDVVVEGTGVIRYGRAAINLLCALIVSLAGYVWLGFVLRRFPYTRPWGDAIKEFLVDRIEWLALGGAHAVPGLVTVVLIVIVTRICSQIVKRLFDAVEHGQLQIAGLYPDTVAPTRKLVTALLWVFALVVAYPFLPGSGTDAFKGVSVFVGIIISLGSTGVVNQVMSGLTVVYSRALRVGDYVRVGEIEGTVSHLGTLSTKIETPLSEEVTIPNTVVIAREVTNYSRHMDATDVRAPASVTIGYDTPWRQVEGLLLLAASRTAGVRSAPAPVVMQTGLNDFYVQYTMHVVLQEPTARVPILSALHANIQDAFNEFGVQIMSPHYLGDPSAAKVVPKDRWSAPPTGPVAPPRGSTD